MPIDIQLSITSQTYIKLERERLTDQQIVAAILNRDTAITREFLYRKCYPMFKATYDKYYTDCEDCFELINEIYVYIMLPHKETRTSKLASFGFRCSLTMWLKIVTENYCRQLYAKKIDFDAQTDTGSDRNILNDDSLISNTNNLDMEDVYKILGAMPNRRYRQLIEYRYVKERSNEETAEALGMSMPNYYNKHKLAKAQFCDALRKEGLL